MSETLQDLERNTTTSKKAKVKVNATPLAQAPWVSFTMCADYPDKGGKQDGDKLKFDPRAGAFELTFDLDDKSGRKLAFCTPACEAIYVAVGEVCPTAAGTGGGTIIPESVIAKQLVVTNTNDPAQTLTFALRFTGLASPVGTTTYVYDPKIINGGDPPMAG